MMRTAGSLSALLRVAGARAYQRGVHPQPFEQTVVLTNGATLKVRTTVPKRTLLLETDCFKSELANPNLIPDKAALAAAAEAQTNQTVKSRFITRVKAPSKPSA